ncbi:MAG: L,D-transpeptidase family protein, partial [Actinomycetota bacterium]
ALAPSEWVQGSPERDSVLLAFNGPLAAADLDSVLDELDATDAKAAFFIRGHWADAHPAAMEALSESGHVVGNAGRRKALKPSAPPKRLRSMIRKGERSLLRRGVDPRPFLSFDGRADRRSLRVAGALGYRSVRPSVWGGRGGPKKVVRRVMARVRPGSIVELRGERSAHVAALATILRRVERAGLGTQSLESLTRTSPVRWDVVLAAGANGRRVRALQKELAADTYPAGPADGTFGTATLDAVYAFEKVNGLTLDGAIDGADMERLLRGGPPDPPPHPEDTYIDIDITRQVLFEVRNGEVVHTVPVSTGNGAAYESRGTTAIASTPRGSFEIYNKIPGWRISHLGALYYPSYFSGGYAIHGSTSVPPYPASHGCVRIPMHVAIEFYERNDYGTPVYVHD